MFQQRKKGRFKAAQQEVGCCDTLGEVGGFSLTHNYTEEGRSEHDYERKGDTSFGSKQMSTRLFSLLQYKGLLTKTHTQPCMHIILDKSMHSAFSNFPRCFAPLLLGEEVTKPATEESLTFCPPFSARLSSVQHTHTSLCVRSQCCFTTVYKCCVILRSGDERCVCPVSVATMASRPVESVCTLFMWHHFYQRD